MFASHHKLGVVDDVEREDESASRPVADHSPLGLGEEGQGDPRNHEDDQHRAESA